jgi:hypothetical protein
MSTIFQYPFRPLDWVASPHDFTGDNILGIYTAETTQRFVLGTTFTAWDGRQWVYCKSAGACLSGQGAEVSDNRDGYVAFTTCTVTASAGDTSYSVPAATHAALTEDYLAGGYICLWIDGASTNDVMMRQIVGNDSASANAAFIVYLEAPLDTAITTSSAAEVYGNPYEGLQTGTMNYHPKIGTPAVGVDAADTYFWCQRRGPTFAAPQGGKLGTTEGGYVGGLWSDYGNISDYNTSLGVTVASGRGSQHAGFAIGGDADNVGPLFYLQG